MPKSVFISYSSKQEDWVFDRLIPCLEASGIPCHVDRKAFEPGHALLDSMDRTQDEADVSLLILSPAYIDSEYCKHELKRAVARDPKFRKGLIVPVMRVKCPLPMEIKKANPLVLDLTSDKESEPWIKLIEACEGSLGSRPVEWLSARDQTRQALKRRESVNLVVHGSASWRPLVHHLKDECFEDLGVVSLEDPGTFTRRGLVQAILKASGSTVQVHDEPRDLDELTDFIESRDLTRIALTHFDRVAIVNHKDQIKLFMALRFWIMDLRKVVMLFQSRTPFSDLVPRDHPLSPITLKMVELRELG